MKPTQEDIDEALAFADMHKDFTLYNDNVLNILAAAYRAKCEEVDAGLVYARSVNALCQKTQARAEMMERQYGELVKIIDEDLVIEEGGSYIRSFMASHTDEREALK
jgi:hypothetical protein